MMTADEAARGVRESKSGFARPLTETRRRGCSAGTQYGGGFFLVCED